MSKTIYIGVHSSMKPILQIAKVFGLCPISFNVISKKMHWESTHKSLAYNILILLLILSSSLVIYTYQEQNFQNVITDSIYQYSDTFRVICAFMAALISTYLSMANRHIMCKFFEDLALFDADFNRLGVSIDYAEIKGNVVKGTILLGVFVSCVVIADFIVFTRLVAVYFVHVYWCTCTALFLVNVAAVLYFIGLTYMVYKWFSLLNASFKTIANQVGRNIKSTTLWTSQNATKAAINDSTRPTPMAVFDSPIYDLMEKQCKMHDKLCDMAKILNSMFCVQFLVYTGVVFFLVVTEFYFFYLMFSGDENHVFEFNKAWLAASWTISSVIMLYIILLFCSITKSEAEETGNLLHQMDFDIQDNYLLATVEMFSLQLCHQRVKFTACGFFPVDFSILYMIMGSVTTYLVFLIQFHMAAKNAQA